MKKMNLLSMAIGLALASSVSFAQEAAPKIMTAPWQANQTSVTLNVSDQKKIAYDVLSVSFRTEGQGVSRKAAYEMAKKELNPVLSRLQEFPATITGNDFNVQPVRDYKDKSQKIVGYRYTYAITLESKDFSGMMQLVDSVSDTLSVSNFSYKMSSQLEEETRAQLMSSVIAKAKRYATAISFSMEASSASLKSIVFNSGNVVSPPMPMVSMMKSARADMTEAMPLTTVPTETEVEVSASVVVVVHKASDL